MGRARVPYGMMEPPALGSLSQGFLLCEKKNPNEI